MLGMLWGVCNARQITPDQERDTLERLRQMDPRPKETPPMNAAEPVRTRPGLVSGDALVELSRLAMERGLGLNQIVDYCRATYGLDSPGLMNPQQAGAVKRWLTGLPVVGSQTKMEL